jgi:hypothetical protein
MADWQDVQNRANAESDFAKAVSAGGMVEIEEFYPELHVPSDNRSFTNTLGGNLIPDLLTSERVVVDVYDWDTPAKLVDVYGVDLDFLLTLRDMNLITICANLPISRYEKHSWLFPILADKRTIHRSIRTPEFFTARDPDFEARRVERERKFNRHFATLPDEDLRMMCNAVKSSHPPADASALASVLAVWLERLVAIDSKVAVEIGDGFEHRVIEDTPQLMQLQRILVSPHSAALGGPMKIARNRWVDIFGDESVDEAVIEGNVRFQTLNNYFTESTLGLDELDLTSAEQWRLMKNAERSKLLDHLMDIDSRRDVLSAEHTLRMGLIKGGDQEPTRESINAYLDQLEAQADILRGFSSLAGIAASVAFGTLSGSVTIGFQVAAGIFGSRYLLGKHARVFTEDLFPKLRVVRILRKSKD